MYFRYFFNSTYLPLGSFVFFMVMYVVGFTFVSVVNLQNERKNPFIGRDGTYKDIKWAAAIALVMYVFAGIVTLRGKNDLYNYCTTEPQNHALNSHVQKAFNHFNLTAAELSDKPL